MLLFFAFLACGHGAADPAPVEQAVPAPQPAEVPAPDPAVGPAPGLAPGVAADGVILGEAGPNGEVSVLAPGVADPQFAAEACWARTKGPEAAGECKVDGDCTKAGCSQEVCVTVAAAKDLNTTCDKLPCFDELEACGCVEGLCSWTQGKSP